MLMFIWMINQHRCIHLHRVIQEKVRIHLCCMSLFKVSQRVHRPQTHPHLTDDYVVMKPLPWLSYFGRSEGFQAVSESMPTYYKNKQITCSIQRGQVNVCIQICHKVVICHRVAPCKFRRPMAFLCHWLIL